MNKEFCDQVCVKKNICALKRIYNPEHFYCPCSDCIVSAICGPTLSFKIDPPSVCNERYNAYEKISKTSYKDKELSYKNKMYMYYFKPKSQTDYYLSLKKRKNYEFL